VEPKIHHFKSSARAYYLSQTGYFSEEWFDTHSLDDPDFDEGMIEVKDGDILVVDSENVIGIMVQAWPTAITNECGVFHLLSNEWTWDTLDGVSTRYHSPLEWKSSRVG